MITLLGKRKQRVIDILRKKYEGHWSYDNRSKYWQCEDGYAAWVHACGCDDTCHHQPDLYFYPWNGPEPELVMHGFWEITR